MTITTPPSILASARVSFPIEPRVSTAVVDIDHKSNCEEGWRDHGIARDPSNNIHTRRPRHCCVLELPHRNIRSEC